ncbi:hypothetical protein ASPACDRAFT_29922 [Aspergillus aculeatus ATCC 16872]|uniref:Zn(2)-C6 fungal-type domain-containing protein n=1 Tax=Aspergillus aculeatus (strain ATCC 16872 / CBS 172.66 / WB 5094) TaxID=690307 RepID=A0A1L9WT84_ASPA1|nr:uncharacterized protein ASPACDRAFT_29922 [Aspergillus aculeatus ATCC 16872]OJJ99338.1 hypothetical protein ASPACDRAFT_29922 [Aspergillus aculeatus ATCC 16872]
MNSSYSQALRTLAPATDIGSLAINPAIIPAQDTVVKPIRKRTNACEACKKRKSRCLGELPCDRCLQTGTECHFMEESDRRRKLALRRIEQELSSAYFLLDQIKAAYEASNEIELERLIRISKDKSALTPRIDYQTRQKLQPLNSRSHALEEPQRCRSLSSSSSTDPVGEIETIDIDVNRDRQSRSTGFIGRGSDIAWLQRLDAEVGGLERPGTEQHAKHNKESLASLNYHLDNLVLADPIHGDSYAMPPKPWADQLLQTYFSSIHQTFPLLLEPLFCQQYENAFRSRLSTPPQSWLVIFNLVLAIGAKSLQLRQEHWDEDLDDRILVSRAIALNAKHNSVLGYVELQQVQIRTLFALYYLVAGQINRSWQLLGFTARSAITLGLNLRVINGHLDHGSKALRSSLWWSIVNLEQVLCTATGRTSCIDWHCFSITTRVSCQKDQLRGSETAGHLHKAQEEDFLFTVYANNLQLQERTKCLQYVQPNASLFFFFLTDLAVIGHAAISSVYSLQSRSGTASKNQHQIIKYQQKLKEWLSSLKETWAFTDSHGHYSKGVECLEKISLAFSFYSIQIILNRPYLTRPRSQKETGVKRPRSSFDDDKAHACLQSALDLISILPDLPDLEWFSTMAPWWSIVHYLMQALVILLLQLCVGQAGVSGSRDITEGEGAVGTAEEPEKILQGSKKCLCWLFCIGNRSYSARNAFMTCDRLLRKIASVRKLDLSDLPASSDLADRTVDGNLQHYYLGSFNAGNTRPLHPRSSTIPSLNHDDCWGADYTHPESAVDEQEFTPLTLDPTLLEVYETLVGDRTSS